MFLRQLAVALAVTLPLAAQVLTRVDAVVTDAQGNRIRGLTAVDFEVTEDGEKRAVEEVVEYSLNAKPAEPVTDPRYVPLITPPSPAPPRRIVVLAEDPAQQPALAARPNDIVTVDTVREADLTSRIAAASLRLARHPEKKGIVVFADPAEPAVSFASRRGVAVVKPEAVEDLSSYYSVSFRSTGGKNISVRTTRALNVRATLASAQPLARDEYGDAVLAHHFVPPQSNDLGITASATPAVPVEGKRKVKLQILVPVRGLVLQRQGDEVTGGFDVLTSIGDGKGRFTRVNRQTHQIKWPAGAIDETGGRNITYSFEIVLEPGSSRISVGVVDHGSKKTGFQRVEVSG